MDLKRLLPVVLLLAPALVLARPMEGERAPDFTISDTAGVAHSLSDYRGTVIHLIFWQSTCTGCRGEMPQAQALYNAYRAAGLVTLAVDVAEILDSTKAFARRYTFPFLCDPTLAAYAQYNDSLYVPVNYVIDASGLVRYGRENVFDSIAVRSAITNWLPVTSDACVRQVTAPSGLLDSGTSVTPACSVHNAGLGTISYRIRMKIGSIYNDTVRVETHLPNTLRYVTFPAWTATPAGEVVVTCSTELSGDGHPTNDRQTDSAFVRSPRSDVGCSRVVAPAGTLDSSTLVTPACSVYNSGPFPVSYAVRMKIGSTYDNTAVVASHAPGTSEFVTFPAWTAGPVGRIAVTCSTELSTDTVNGNDRLADSVLVRALPPPEYGWVRKADVPAGPRGKPVKDGGCLAYSDEGGAGYVYAFKGNGRYEFYKYSAATNTWGTKESIPATGASGKKKAVKKGAAMAMAEGKLYAAKGNGTLDWWRYDPVLSGSPTYPWTLAAQVPLGAKACKEGCGAATVRVGDTSYIYFLKGSNTLEFYRYNSVTAAWATMANAPAGTSGKNFKNGSALAADGAATVWAVKGSYNEFYAYDVAANTWNTLASLPFTGSLGKKKKVKDGACLVHHQGNVYGLKGGGTSEFWKYHASTTGEPIGWYQLSDVPAGSGKPVRGGGAAAYSGHDNALYFLKGNKTPDFFKYGLSAYGLQLAANGSENAQSAFRNPQSTFGIRLRPSVSVCGSSSAIRIDYILPRAGDVSLKLYDITGQLVATLASGRRSAGEYSLALAGRRLAAGGVYLLELRACGLSLAQKLIIE